MRSSWTSLMPLPSWFGRRRSKQHGSGLTTGPRRLVVNQWRCMQVLAEQQQEARMECKGSVETWFAQFVPKLLQSIPPNLEEVWCTAMHAGASLQIRRVDLATSLSTLLIKRCRGACGSSGTTSLLLMSGCSKTASASQTTGSWGRKNGTLLATTRAISSTMLLEDKMRQGSVVNQCNRGSHSWRALLSNTLFNMHTFAWEVLQRYGQKRP